MRMTFLCVNLVLLWNFAFAADSLNVRSIPAPTSPGNGTLSVESSPTGVGVYCDTLYLGITPLDSAGIPTGRHVMTFVHPEARIWQNSSAIETLVVHPTEHVHRSIVFPSFCHITSSPFGATVQLGDSVVGLTPLLLALTSNDKLLTFSKTGYEQTSTPLRRVSTEIHVDLRPLAASAAPDQSLFLADSRSKDGLPLYLTTGAAVLGGVVAAYCKIKADSHFNDYLISGNPQTLADVRRLDTVAGISLAASEASLLTLCYFLISR